MMMNQRQEVTVKVPATTANLGSGFDCIGLALTLYNQFTFALAIDKKNSFQVKGAGAEQIELNEDNLLYQSFRRLYDQVKQTPPAIEVSIEINVPLARGLGSSATAIIGGLLGANYFLGQPLNSTELLNLAIAIEGHPDNVAPALLGNCILSVQEENNWQFVPIDCHQDLAFVLAIPNFELSTAEARKVLPSQLTYASAIYNISHFGLLIKALETGKPEWLKIALNDQLHQPYRQSLITGYQEIKKSALSAGAYGMVISGAGPTLLSVTNKNQALQVCQAMEQTWQSMGIEVKAESLDLDQQGAVLQFNN